MKITPDLTSVIPKDKKEKKEMLSVRQEGSHTIVRVNSSSLSLMQNCWRKAYYVLVEEYVSNYQSPALIFGSAIHKALEVFYLGAAEDRLLPAHLGEQMEKVAYGLLPQEFINKTLLLKATQAFIEVAAPLKDIAPGNKRSVNTGLWILENYFRKYIDDPYVVLNDKEGPIVERGFTFQLHKGPALTIDYFGTIDVVLQHKETGAILITDHKTSSVVGQSFYNKIKPNHQYTGYLMGAQRALGLDTDKFLVNCLQVKEKPKTKRGTPPDFPRQVTTRSELDFGEFQMSVHKSVRGFLSRIQCSFQCGEDAATYLPGYTWELGDKDSCSLYGGCQFLDVCAAPACIRESMLKTKYTSGGNNE